MVPGHSGLPASSAKEALNAEPVPSLKATRHLLLCAFLELLKSLLVASLVVSYLLLVITAVLVSALVIFFFYLIPD